MQRAGRRSKRITLERHQATKDRVGGNVSAWSIVARVWASVRNLSGDERRMTKQGGEEAQERSEFGIVYRRGIDATMRIRYAGATYNVRHVNNVNEANESLVLTCDLEPAGAET